MAVLEHTLTDNVTKVRYIKNSNSETVIDTDNLVLGGYYNRRIINQVFTGSWDTSTERRDFKLIYTFPEIQGFKAGSLVEINYHIPTRNDNESWGGFYVEPQVRFNLGEWFSLGGSGFDLMYLGARCIGSYYNGVFFNPQQSVDFSVQFRFYLAAYTDSTRINGSHSLGTRSNTSAIPDLPDNDSLQHYFNIKVEELAKMGGY